MPATILHPATQARLSKQQQKHHKMPQQRNIFVLSVSGTFLEICLKICRFARCKLSVIRQSVPLFLCATVRPEHADWRRGGLVTQCTISAFLVSIMIKDHISIVLSS